MKKHSWPENHWHWPVELSHYHGVRSGKLVHTGGQADLNRFGVVVNPGNLEQQTINVVQHVANILKDLNTTLSDIVRFVMYFVGNADDEHRMLTIISEQLDGACKPTISTICLPELCYPGMCIELEAIAIDSSDNNYQDRQEVSLDSLPAIPEGFSHVVRCGDLVYTSDMSSITPSGEVAFHGDVIEQTKLMLTQLDLSLTTVGSSAADVLKLNVFYCGDGTAQNWAAPAQIRADYFPEPGPAATGISLPSFAVPGLMTKIAVTASVPTENRIDRQFSWPDNHWDWTMKLPYQHGNRFNNLIHVGGQVALDNNARVLHPNDIVAQTHIALKNIKSVLQELGAGIDDIVKVTTFYQGKSSAENLHQNLEIRSAAFKRPGPATSGIPIPYLVYEHMVIEIEVIAMLENTV